MYFLKTTKKEREEGPQLITSSNLKHSSLFFSFDFLSSLKPKLETRLSISISQFFSSWHGSLTIIIHSLGTPEQRPEIEKRVSERKKLIKKAEHLLHHIVYPIEQTPPAVPVGITFSLSLSLYNVLVETQIGQFGFL